MPLPNILITGGTGLLGRELTAGLLAKGYQVSHLSRNPGKDNRVKTFLWDADKGKIDERCLDGIDIVIHLAGANISEKRWTKSRKKQIIDSRVKSIQLIYNLMRRRPNQVKRVISASGVSYYGNCGDSWLSETSEAAHDFLGECCILWEQAADEGLKLGLNVVKFRTGVVLTKEGGALPLMSKSIKLGVGAPLGNGKQWMPWIHHQDAIDMYLFAIENPHLSGVYNMVAPNPVTNRQLTQAIARQLHKPLWLPNVPAFLLRLILGEMSKVALDSLRISSDKIGAAGFQFHFAEAGDALKEIYER